MNLTDLTTGRIHFLVSYFSTLYYVEIVVLMVSVLFVYGKFASVTVGIVLSILLTLQIVRIFYKRDRYRKIQLILMDLHLAYGLAFFATLPWSGFRLDGANALVFSVRLILVAGEIVLIFLLTDRKITAEFT